MYPQNVWLMIVYLLNVSEALDGWFVRNTSMQQQSKVCQQNKKQTQWTELVKKRTLNHSKS